MLAEDAEKLYLSHIAGGNVKLYSHFGKYFGSFIKRNTKHMQILHQLHSWSFILEKWIDMFMFKKQNKKLDIITNSNFICNRPKLQTTQMCYNMWIFKQNVYMHSMKYYWVMKSNKLFIDITWIDLVHYAEWEKKANLKQLHPLWFHLYSITKLWRWKTICQGLGIL